MVNAAEPSEEADPQDWSCPERGAKVFVSASGVITLNGRMIAAADLTRALAELDPRPPVVCYSRDNPQGEPPPGAMAAMEAIIAAGLPIALFTDATFSLRLDDLGRPLGR
jgi:hypothetical protein